LFTFRKAGSQVSPVTISHPYLRTAALFTLFTTGYKRLTEGGLGFLLWAVYLRLLLFAFGLLAFGFLMWKALERKRIVKGKRIAEGTMLEGDC
jgi:hypothetical protein